MQLYTTLYPKPHRKRVGSLSLSLVIPNKTPANLSFNVMFFDNATLLSVESEVVWMFEKAASRNPRGQALVLKGHCTRLNKINVANMCDGIPTIDY